LRQWTVGRFRSCREGPGWTYEIKLDGYRLEAVKNGGETTLYSRRRNVLNKKFQYIADALKKLPEGIIVDAEYIRYYAFDVLTYKGKTLLAEPLEKRRTVLGKILPRKAAQSSNDSGAAIRASLFEQLIPTGRFRRSIQLRTILASSSSLLYL
jgi:ATP-dependent DNA ligase